MQYKQQVLKDTEAHVYRATQERFSYRSAIGIAKEVLKETFTMNGQLEVQLIGACMHVCHLQYKTSQQVYYSTGMDTHHYMYNPSDLQQSGPMYFLTPPKCAEAVPRQVHFN